MAEFPLEDLGAGVVKRSTRLADGRELIYYDDPGTTLGPDRAVDARELAPRPRPRRCAATSSPATGCRSPRPARTARSCPRPSSTRSPRRRRRTRPRSRRSTTSRCSRTSRRRSARRSPRRTATRPRRRCAARPRRPRRPGLGRTRTSVGRCEVVCFSPEHSGSFGTQTRTRARTVIEAWADRTAALSALPGVEQVFPFENRGEAIGVTLAHPHGQIYAYPYITPRTHEPARLDRPRGTRPLRADPRVRAGLRARHPAGEHWTAFVPFAARWPLEVHLLPHRHVPDFAETTDAERDELAPLYLRLLRGVDALYDSPTPYIAAWHQAPVHRGRDTRPPAPAAHLAAPRRRQAQVPRRLRGRDGRLDRRHPARDLRRAPARRRGNRAGGDRVTTATARACSPTSSAPSRSAPGRPPAASTSSASTPTTTTASCCRSRSSTARTSRSTPRDDGVIRVGSTFDDDAVEVPLADLDASSPRAATRSRSGRATRSGSRGRCCARSGAPRIRHRRRPRVHLRRAGRRRPLVVGGDRGRDGDGAERHLGARARPRRPRPGRPHRRERGGRRPDRDHGPDGVDARPSGCRDLPRLPLARGDGRRPRLRRCRARSCS